ncbi:YobI family P-loop NTPase [Bacillus sp. JJ1562]|uniref:YobI family P-loop NTPase n=1 Tax=Bacillus sp. JJ1562 TaxID=3122960 RepID=UPI003003942A
MSQIIEYESLAAKKELDEGSEFYLETLEYALKDVNNRNIAITGGYGAGKTTIIDSYFEKNEKEAKKMMRVSIATFQTDEKPPIASQKEHNLLEQQILQQMFYQVNPNKIPNSKFTKISDLSFWYVFGVLFYLLFTIVLTILIVNNNWLNQYYSSSESFLAFFESNWLWLLLLGLIIIFNGISVYCLIIIFRKLGISRFGVASTSIEFNFKDGSTVFNHYLDEIIYLFKKTKYQYIIFEDLDRFQDINIFERLRSLNTALNSSIHLKNKNIKFVYALKDDIFTGEDETESIYNRTKFFDFIIPAVNVMHSSNAESILLEKLEKFLPNEKEGEYNNDWSNQKLSRKLIEDVALFINDMRTLINICNEFEIFRQRLHNSSVTYDNLFAFIVYKNIYPKDYSDLLENKGLVFDVFNKKEEIIRSLEEKIQKLQNKSINGLGSIITDQKDIAMLFAQKRKLTGKRIVQYRHHLFSFSSTSFGDRYVQDGQGIFDYILKEHLKGEFSLFQGDTLLNTYTNVEEFVTINSVNYLELYRDFEQNRIQKKEEIQTEIDEIRKKIKNVYIKSIYRLIKEDGIDLHLDLSNKKLLYYLVRNNWLNEFYEDYLTVFREGSITKKGNEFIQAIKLGYSNGYLHLRLNNSRKVAEKIRVDDINSLAVLNLDFIVYLLKNNNETNIEKLTKIINILFHNLEPHFEDYMMLIEGLKKEISKENLIWKFLQISMKSGIDIWKVVEDTNVSKEQKESYVIILLENCNIKELELKSTSNLRKFVSHELDVEKLTNSENLFNVIEGLGIRFASLSGVKEEIILTNIVKINSYQINLENLKKILGTKNISVQIIEEYEQIYDYCFDSDNINSFITDVLIQQEDYNEEEDTFVRFIEHMIDPNIDISRSLVESIIRHWSGVINVLNRVESFELIRILLNENKFKLTWENIEFCRNVFLKNEETFNEENLLLSENHWKELIENSSESIQTDFKDEEKYNLFVIPILKLNIEKHPMIEEFVARLKFPVSLKERAEVDRKVIELLIEHELLSWNVEIYLMVDSVQHKVSFIKGNIHDASEELPSLIKDGELVWSLDLFKMIVELDELEADIIHQYIRDYIHQIEYGEFKSVMSIFELKYDNEIISELTIEPSKKDLLILYLLQLWKSGATNHVGESINEYSIPWSKKLFEVFRKDDIEVAGNYLVNHIDWIDEIKMDQELFNSLIAKCNVEKSVINLINKFHHQFEINDLIAKKSYEFLLNNPEDVVSSLDESAVIKNVECLPLEAASKFLYHFLVYKEFNREEIFEILSKLSEPLCLIKLNGGQLRIEKTHSNVEELMEYLKSGDIQVISTIVPMEQGYLVNNKRK